jgi:hypothetical protein
LRAERGTTVDQVPGSRRVQRSTPPLIDAARPCRHPPGDRWFEDETCVTVTGGWVSPSRAIDQDDPPTDGAAPTRDRTRLHPARVLSTGPAFRQNRRHDHDEPGLDADPQNRLPATFTACTL